ncbi:MAG: hypothetical protein OJF50_004346 [Nitrospira sp.]|jgi:hypothetical protein|nr:hypothetical protein [Nitrospira sp.]
MLRDWLTRQKSVAVICPLLLLSACSGTRMIVPPSTPLNPNRSAVGISLKGGGAFAPTAVYFIRVQDGEDAASGMQLITSNYQTRVDMYQQFYLVNAEPGRYLAVACIKENWGTFLSAEALTYFRKHSIKMTEVVVRPGEVGFMGEYDLSYPFVALLYQNDPDEAQLHYQKLMVSNPPTGFLGNLSAFYLSGVRYLSASLANPESKEKGKFLFTATEELRKDAWVMLIMNRLSKLNSE